MPNHQAHVSRHTRYRMLHAALKALSEAGAEGVPLGADGNPAQDHAIKNVRFMGGTTDPLIGGKAVNAANFIALGIRNRAFGARQVWYYWRSIVRDVDFIGAPIPGLTEES